MTVEPLSLTAERVTRLLGAPARLSPRVTHAIASPVRLATDWHGFVAETPEGRFFIKMLRPRQDAVIEVDQVAQAARLAGQAGVAPGVRAVDAVDGLIAYDCLDAAGWHWCYIDDLIAPAVTGRLLNLKRRFHAAGRLGFERDLFGDAKRLLGLAHGAGASLPANAAWLETCIALIEVAIKAAGSDLVPIHSDGAASNVLKDADGNLMLVDFDRAGQGDPWLDVATTLNELCQFEEEWQAGIEQWAGVCRQDDYARCRLYGIAEDWYWGLWGLWAAAVYRGQGIEFFKYGQWRLLRLRQALSDPRFEAWLRRV